MQGPILVYPGHQVIQFHLAHRTPPETEACENSQASCVLVRRYLVNHVGRTFGVSEHFSRQMRDYNPASAAFLALKGRFCARYNPETGVKTKQGILQPRFLDDSDNEGDQVDDDAVEDRNQADSHSSKEYIGGDQVE